MCAAARRPLKHRRRVGAIGILWGVLVLLGVHYYHPTAAAATAASAASSSSSSLATTKPTTTTRRTTTTSYSVDVSGHPDWRENPVVLTDFLSQHLDNVSHAMYHARRCRGDNSNNPTSIDDDPAVDVTIDVSHCALTDDDFIDLIDRALFPLRHPNNDRPRPGLPLRLHLYARANHDLTPRSISHLLERVLDLHNQTRTTTTAAALGGVDGTSTSNNNNTNATNATIPDGGEPVSSNSNATTNGAVTVAAEKEDGAAPNNNSNNNSTAAASTKEEVHADAVRRLVPPPIRYLGSLDLCWSRLGDPPPFVEIEIDNDAAATEDGTRKRRNNHRRRRQKLHQQELVHARAFRKALRTLVATPHACPSILRLDRCGLGPSHCRSLAKGLLSRWGVDEDDDNHNVKVGTTSSTEEPRRHKRLALHLSGNGAVGDAGAAALAAALRTVATATAPSSGHQHPRRDDGTNNHNNHEEPPLLDVLDLSACQVGDAGAQAMAVALEEDVDASDGSGTVLVHLLDLKLNRITDVGAAALGRALSSRSSSSSQRPTPPLQCLDLSGNADVGDKGATALALALGTGHLPIATVRCCAIGADGAAAFGRALRRRAAAATTPTPVEVDLSGNPLGVLRGKKKDEGKYSASRLKSKATATAASYMNQGVSFLKRNLKDVGVDVSPIFGSSLESDDEEEEEKDASGLPDEEYDPSKGRCGAKSLVNAFLEAPKDGVAAGGGLATGLYMKLGLRHCSFDHGAADALAALRVHARDELGLDLEMDVRLNSVLEEEMVGALHGDKAHDDLLREMAERHQDALEALREARERAAYASAAVTAKVRARADANDQYEAQWDAPDIVDDQSEEWDSDAGKCGFSRVSTCARLREGSFPHMKGISQL